MTIEELLKEIEDEKVTSLPEDCIHDDGFEKFLHKDLVTKCHEEAKNWTESDIKKFRDEANSLPDVLNNIVLYSPYIH